MLHRKIKDQGRLWRKSAGLIEDKTFWGNTRFPKRATASRPYELFDDP